MKRKIYLFTASVLLLSMTCCGDLYTPIGLLKKADFKGFVQKGPYMNGSKVFISELDPMLKPTGRIFSTTVSDNSGSFKLKEFELKSDFVELKAEGYYFNEVSGKTSSDQLTLYALVNIAQVSSANINVLTNLEKNRVEYLVQQKGQSFVHAKKQAQQEVLSLFSLELCSDSTSESLNLSEGGENNAILLAVSCILQGQLSTADMVKLMDEISSDIQADGKLHNLSLGSQLINNARLISLPSVYENIVTKFASLGLNNVVTPEFEKYVEEFKAKTSYSQVNTFNISN
ncbi:MAG: hypothetical protein Q8904_00890 [Bacteroidota bacterium]|nr:hypothetical protein [Bacteroidota bacterium]